jgi:hypothetical protein
MRRRGGCHSGDDHSATSGSQKRACLRIGAIKIDFTRIGIRD